MSIPQGYHGQSLDLLAVSQSYAAQGWQVQASGPTQVVLTRPHKWALHLVLSVVTCGLWLFGWPFVFLFERNKVTLSLVRGQVSVVKSGRLG